MVVSSTAYNFKKTHTQKNHKTFQLSRCNLIALIYIYKSMKTTGLVTGCMAVLAGWSQVSQVSQASQVSQVSPRSLAASGLDELPKLLDGAHPSLPHAAAALELRLDKERGRHLVASKHIPAGQVRSGQVRSGQIRSELS